MRQIIGRILLLISFTVFSVIVARAQSPPAAAKTPATISGRVTLDNNGVPGVQVILKLRSGAMISIGSGSEQASALSAITDAEGRYRLTDVPPGSHRVSAFAPAYAIEGESLTFTPGKTVNVAEGENVENLDFSLARGGVITGKVIDEKDRPVIAAPVGAYKLGPDDKRQQIGLSTSVRWETDDRGVYRIFGLESGRYLVAAGIYSDDMLMSLSGTGGASHRRAFHPDALEEEQAKVVEVKGGEEAANIDIKIEPPVKGYVVTGRVVEADTDKPIPGVTVNYSGARQNLNIGGVRSAVTNSLGEFRFENVPPNSYRAFTIDTQGVIPMFGDQITFDVVAGNVSGLEIRTQRGATISGVVSIEGSNDPALRANLAQVSLIAPGRGMIFVGPGGNGTINPNGTFKLSGVKPGKTRITMLPIGPKGFALLRIEHNGVEVKDFNVNEGDRITGVRLVFAYGNGGNSVIAGRVEVKGGALPPGARLEVNAWRQGAVVIDQQNVSISAEVDGRGQFVIEGLSQGIYKLVLTGENPFNLFRVEQMVTIAGEGRHEVTLVVDLTPNERDK